jgi:hypothetical protein
MIKKLLKNILFVPDKISRKISNVLIKIILVLGVIIVWFNTNADAKLLRQLSEFSMTVVLAILALGISVLQTECVQKKSMEMYLKYIFSMFNPILVIVLGFLISMVSMEGECVLIKAWINIMLLVLLNAISNSLKYFVFVFNIKD